METEEDYLYYFVASTIFSVIFSSAVLLVLYFSKLMKFAEKKEVVIEEETTALVSENVSNVKYFEQFNARKDTTAAAAGSHKKKKNTDNRWANRTDKQGFTHPWLFTSLKGHTGQVLDMDFASNGKYLASCADEEPDPGDDLVANTDTGGTSSGSECNKENSRPSSADQSPRVAKPLSRRQRKNRRREDSSSPETKKKSKPKKASSPAATIPITPASNSSEKKANDGAFNKKSEFPSYVKLGLKDGELYRFLRSYLLSPEQMLTLGYPVEYAIHPGRAVIFKSPIPVPSYPKSAYKYNKPESKSGFDVNAREFIPNIYKNAAAMATGENSSGHDSGNSSDSGENDSEDSSSSSSSSSLPSEKAIVRTYQQALVNGPQTHFSNPAIPLYEKSETTMTVVQLGEDISQKTCVRCGVDFLMNSDNTYVTQDQCLYHWGKLTRVLGENRSSYAVSNEYMCCGGKQSSKGCTQGKLHVWNGLVNGVNGPFDNYVKTKSKQIDLDVGPGVYALDCEMCFTGHGLELVKISVVSASGRLVYDVYVKPENEVIDYNSRFSGITAKDLQKKRTLKTLKEVQNDLMGFISADTILIGHGLENDLRALKILHPTVIDTAVAFPHYNGLPYRRSLKSLISCFLKREIQTGSNGHNSYEDAKACMELMLWRVRNDFRCIIDHQHHQTYF
ncbi:WD40 domain-containing protein [Oryctes borbonicus]|uniref:WD40 domain-containing protein n=1 Tax=Oryctes borbonicus TaxID=1629725 RepID=A0A0T6BEP4_9SCAR|nr:WD40 domain-containing protein [Oryctes borbonicus]